MNADDSGDWRPCPPGLLRERGVRALWQRRRRAVAMAAGAGALLMLLGIGAWPILGRLTNREQHFGGIACSEVRASLPALISGGLAEDVAARVRAHLDLCPECQALLQTMPRMEAVGWFPVHTDRGHCRCAACRTAQLVAHKDRLGHSSPQTMPQTMPQTTPQTSLAALAVVGN